MASRCSNSLYYIDSRAEACLFLCMLTGRPPSTLTVFLPVAAVATGQGRDERSYCLGILDIEVLTCRRPC